MGNLIRRLKIAKALNNDLKKEDAIIVNTIVNIFKNYEKVYHDKYPSTTFWIDKNSNVIIRYVKTNSSIIINNSNYNELMMMCKIENPIDFRDIFIYIFETHLNIYDIKHCYSDIKNYNFKEL